MPALSSLHKGLVLRMGRRDAKSDRLWARRDALTRTLIGKLTDCETDCSYHDTQISGLLLDLHANIQTIKLNEKRFARDKKLVLNIEYVLCELGVTP